MSHSSPDWPEVRNDENSRYHCDPARRVAAPAIALLLVGGLGIAANVLMWMAMVMLRDRTPPPRPAGMDGETYEAYQRGRTAAPFLSCVCLSVPTFAIYPLIIVAGTRMREMRNPKTVVLGAILAMFPGSVIVLAGLPVAIWTLVVMADPAVRAEFSRRSRRP